MVVRGKGKNRRNAHGRRWKTLEDVAGRRGEASQNRLEDVILILKRRKAFSFLKFEIHVFQAISRGFPTSSSNVFQRLPTSSICVETICGDGGHKTYIFLHGDTRVPIRKVGTQRTKPYNSNATHVT